MAVKDSVPELYNFVLSAQGKPSHPFCGEFYLKSAEGVQQGDPLGPLLFCLTIHTVVAQLHSEFRVFYLDDGSIGGSFENVLHDFRAGEELAALQKMWGCFKPFVVVSVSLFIETETMMEGLKQPQIFAVC